MLNKERIVREFIELVGVPCPSKDERREAELIMARLRALGLEPEMDDVHLRTGGTCGNVWAYFKGNVPNAPVLFFEAHMDSVAPATGTKVVRRGGVLYSDGTTTLGGDDKVGVAAMLELVRALQEDAVPHGDIQLLFTVSEETGCLGARYLERSRIRGDFGYCLDTGGTMGEITYAAPKLYELYAAVTGKAAHAGVAPETGINAIMLAAGALSKIPAHGRLDHETTLNTGVFHGGIGNNIVAPEAAFVIDMRSLDVQKLERLKDSTIDLLRRHVEAGGGKFSVEVREACPAVAVDTQHAAVKLAIRAAEALGYPPSLKKAGGCSDANFLCGYGLPCVLLATGMSNIHTTEEYLAEDDLFGVARWMYEIVRLAAQN